MHPSTESAARTDLPAQVGRVPPWGPAAAWGIFSLLGLVGSVSAYVWPIGTLESWLALPHAPTLGLWAFATTLTAGVLAYLTARVTLGRWPLLSALGAVVLLAGAGVAGAHLWLLMDWGVGAFDSFDPEYLGSAVFLWAIVAGVAVAGFGVQIGPVGSRWPAALGVALGVLLAAGVGLTYLPRLLDGIAPTTVAPAVASVAALAYIGAVAAATLWRLLRPGAR
jgi:hypothetical protein